MVSQAAPSACPSCGGQMWPSSSRRDGLAHLAAMPYRKRVRIELTEDWSQLQLQRAWPERTIYGRADRFDTEGMASVFTSPAAKRAAGPAPGDAAGDRGADGGSARLFGRSM